MGGTDDMFSPHLRFNVCPVCRATLRMKVFKAHKRLDSPVFSFLQELKQNTLFSQHLFNIDLSLNSSYYLKTNDFY